MIWKLDNNSGFSTLELTIVVLILSIVGLIGGLSVRQRPLTAVDYTVRKLNALLLWARRDAASVDHSLSLEFDLDSQVIALVEGAEQSRAVESFQVPRNLVMTEVETEDSSVISGKCWLQFAQGGIIQSARITITTQEGEVFEASVPSFMSRVTYRKLDKRVDRDDRVR